MRILNIVGMSLIALSSLCLLWCLISDICLSLKCRKSSTDDFVADDDEDEDDFEPYIPKLSGDALQKLIPGREACFVEQEIFPAVPRILSFLTPCERKWVSDVLSAFIGIVVDTAPDYEQDFYTVLEILRFTEIPEDADEFWKSPAELLMDDNSEARFFPVYDRFRKDCTEQETIYLLCTQIIQSICVKLYDDIPLSVSNLPRRITMKGVPEE